MKIVVRGTNWVGDAVMTIPALRMLRAAYPEAEISLLTRSWAEGIFRDADFLDRIVSFEATGSRRRDLAAQRRLLKGGDFDLAILFTNSFESALAVSLAGIKRRIGYAKEGRGFLLTDAVPVPDWKNRRHEVNYYANLVAEAARRTGVGEIERSHEVTIPVSNSRIETASAFLRTAGIDLERPIIALGAGSTNSNAKRWPTDRYARLGDLLAAELDAQVILLGSKEDAEVAARIIGSAEFKPVDLTGRTGLAEAVAILATSDAVVSNDMGLAHIAPAVGTPTLVLFGPTNDATTRPVGSEIIRKPFDCAPCMLRECPIDHRCMTAITADEVFERTKALINKKRK